MFTNETCPTVALLWTSQELRFNRFNLILIVLVIVLHTLFWLQIVLCSSLQKLSMIWLYNYMATDYLSISQLIIEYITRSMSICPISVTAHSFLCTIEGYANQYIAYTQAYTLTLVGIWRYYHIVRGSPPLNRSRSKIFAVHLCLYSISFLWVLIKNDFELTTIVDELGASCFFAYSSLVMIIIDYGIGLILPIVVNVYFLIITVQYVRHSQNTVRSVRRIHRRLILQFSILYTVWFFLFIPQSVISLVMSASAQQRFLSKMLSLIDTLFDVVIITVLDKKFIDVWTKLYRRQRRRVNPMAIDVHVKKEPPIICQPLRQMTL